MKHRLCQRLAFLPHIRTVAPQVCGLLAIVVGALACAPVLPAVAAQLLLTNLALASLLILASLILMVARQPAASAPAYAAIYMRELGAAACTSPAAPEPPAAPATLDAQQIAELVAVSGDPAQLPALAERGGALLGAALLLIGSYNTATAELHIRAAHGPQAGEWIGQRMIWPGLEAMNSPLRSVAAAAEPQFAPAHTLLAAASCLAAALVPLRTRDGLIGALLVAGQPGVVSAATQPAIDVLAGLARISLVQTLLHDEASRAARTRAAILDTISHEFRTPITVILGFTELYEEGVLGPIASDQQHEALGAIHRNTYRLLRLVDGLLDLARIESGEIELHTGAVRLGPCLQEALLPFEQLIISQQLTFEPLSETLPRVWADPQWLRRAVAGMLIFALEIAPAEILHFHARSSDSEVVTLELALAETIIPSTAQAGLFGAAPEDGGIWRGSALARLGLELSRRTLELLGGRLRIEQGAGGARLVAELRTAE
jgi:hypothetical protein